MCLLNKAGLTLPIGTMQHQWAVVSIWYLKHEKIIWIIYEMKPQGGAMEEKMMLK